MHFYFLDLQNDMGLYLLTSCAAINWCVEDSGHLFGIEMTAKSLTYMI